MLCSDKTGTLTANKLSLNKPYVAPDVDPNWFMAVAVLASSHKIKSLDPIDKVTIVGLKVWSLLALSKHRADWQDYPKAQEMLQAGWKTHKFTPFDPVSKRITAEVEKNGKKYTCAKGAPNAILKLAKFEPSTVDAYRSQAAEFATRGFRSLGVAVKQDGKEWELLGMLCMFDPPRADTRQTIDEAHKLGISVKVRSSLLSQVSPESLCSLASQIHLPKYLVAVHVASFTLQLHYPPPAIVGSTSHLAPSLLALIPDAYRRRGRNRQRDMQTTRPQDKRLRFRKTHSRRHVRIRHSRFRRSSRWIRRGLSRT